MRPRKPLRDGNSSKMVVPVVFRKLLNRVRETGWRHGRNGGPRERDTKAAERKQELLKRRRD